MHPQDELYNLIRSLTPNEKRYFKVFAQRHVLGNKNSYELLFDAFDKWTGEYNETAFKSTLKGKNYGKNFASDKNYLHNLIMDAMRAYQVDDKPEDKITNLLADEVFYRAKRLNRLRLKAIEKAKEIAWKYEMYSSLVTILQLEAAARMELEQEHLDKNAEMLEKEMAKVFHLLDLSARLNSTFNRVFTRARQNMSSSPAAQKYARQVLESELIAGYKPGIGFTCDRSWYQVKSICGRILNLNEDYFNNLKGAYDLYSKYPAFHTYNVINYKITLYNLMSACLRMEKFDLFQQLLDEAKAVSPAQKDEEGEDWQNLVHLELMYCINTGNFQKGASLMEEIDRGLVKYSNKVNTARKIVLLRNLSMCLIILKNYDRAMDYNNEILNDKTEARDDIKSICRMVDILLHYQTGNYPAIDGKTRNVQRMITKERPLTEQEKFFFNTFRQLVKILPKKPSRGFTDDLIAKWEETTGLENGLVPSEFGTWLNYLA